MLGEGRGKSMFSRFIQKVKSFFNPEKPLQKQAISLELEILYNDWLTRRRDPNRKTCKHGHRICLENAHPNDLRHLGLYYCKICQKRQNQQSKKRQQHKVADARAAARYATSLVPANQKVA